MSDYPCRFFSSLIWEKVHYLWNLRVTYKSTYVFWGTIAIASLFKFFNFVSAISIPCTEKTLLWPYLKGRIILNLDFERIIIETYVIATSVPSITTRDLERRPLSWIPLGTLLLLEILEVLVRLFDFDTLFALRGTETRFFIVTNS